MTHLSRRHFLHAAAAFGSYSMMPALTMAAAPTDLRLVVIILRGGMDGLDVVQPWGDPAYEKLRPKAGGMGPSDGFALTDFYGLHHALKPLQPMFEGRELGFVHAVSTPYRARSHFEAQDVLERGAEHFASSETGWVNRLIGLVGSGKVEFAADIGSGSSLLMRGDAQYLNLFPESDMGFWGDSGQFLEMLYAQDPALKASYANIAASAADSMQSENVDRGVSKREITLLAAKLLRQDCRIASFSLHGWDTHSGQTKRLNESLSTLAQTLDTLKSALGKVWQKTLVVAASEFGRTARFNGTLGTDHGTAGAMLLAGGLLANGAGGKVLSGEWPGLAPDMLYEGRDLRPTDDVRRYIGWSLASLYGLSGPAIAKSIFPGVELGAKVNLI